MAKDYIFILVNGRQYAMKQKREATFAEIVSFEYPHGRNRGLEDATFAVTYRNGPQENRRGTMVAGDSVALANGMLFAVQIAGNA